MVDRVDATDVDKGENARVTYSVRHGNEEGLFHVEQLTGAVTTTRRLPSTGSEYRLVIAAADHGQPARMSVIDLRVVVNDSYSQQTRPGVTDTLLVGDDRFFVVLGMMSGVVVVCLLAALVCALFVLRRAACGAKRAAADKPLPLTDDDMLTTAALHRRHSFTSATDTASSVHDWSKEYTRMINVRVNYYNCIHYTRPRGG